MVDRQSPNDELDLLAYADGFLDDDPLRKARVERKLHASPAEAQRARAYRAQTEALRREYAGCLEDPVPDRLYAALEGSAWPAARTMVRVAAVVALMIGTGVSGWLANQWSRSLEWSTHEFIEESYRNFSRSTEDAVAGPKIALGNSAEPLVWLSEKISLTLRAPDLSDMGFAIVDKRTMGAGNDQMVRLTYAAPDGRKFSLFLRPRWEGNSPDLKVVNEGDVTLVYWLDGPLASTIASRSTPDETVKLATAVRRAMQDRSVPPPAVESTPPRPSRQGAGLTTGGLAIEPAPPAGRIIAPMERPTPASDTVTAN